MSNIDKVRKAYLDSSAAKNLESLFRNIMERVVDVASKGHTSYQIDIQARADDDITLQFGFGDANLLQERFIAEGFNCTIRTSVSRCVFYLDISGWADLP